jgi:hypothetical protein
LAELGALAAVSKWHEDATVADPILAKTSCAERAEQQRELRQRIKSVASLLIALRSELPDPSDLADPAQAAQMRRLLLRYIGPAQDRLADYERLLTGQSRLKWFR